MRQDLVVSKSESEFVTIKMAAEILFLSTPTIRRLLGQKRLKRYKAAGRTLLSRSEVMRFIKAA